MAFDYWHVVRQKTRRNLSIADYEFHIGGDVMRPCEIPAGRGVEAAQRARRIRYLTFVKAVRSAPFDCLSRKQRAASLRQ